MFEKVKDRDVVKKMIFKFWKLLVDKLFLFIFRIYKEGGSMEMDESFYIVLLEMVV